VLAVAGHEATGVLLFLVRRYHPSITRLSFTTADCHQSRIVAGGRWMIVHRKTPAGRFGVRATLWRPHNGPLGSALSSFGHSGPLHRQTVPLPSANREPSPWPRCRNV
jgi:hypothetical protein